MDAADLTNPLFTDEDAAWAHYETVRWPDGAICPKCGSVGNSTRLENKTTTRTRKDKDGNYVTKSWTRRGVHKCKDCGEQFTATVGTIFESSHIPMNKWLLAMHLMCASKKGISALQLHRMLGFGSYRTAWFMAHRIREAMDMKKGPLPPMGGAGGIVEADETYYGKVENPRGETTDGRKFKRGGRGRGPANKRAVLALVERGGAIRTFHVAEANRDTVEKIVRENVAKEARLHTDESRLYPRVGQEFASHETVRHTAGEYARGDVHINSAEGFFGVFKKGMTGVYQHCDEKHLHRYLNEFEFRFNTRTKLGVTDKERAALAVKGTVGKRLTYCLPRNTVS